jgi:putative transposase
MEIYRNNTHAHSVSWNTWHFEWCTKYRYKMFRTTEIKNLCSIAIIGAADRHKIEVIHLEIDLDHVHVIATIPMTMSPTEALHKLKGFSSKIIFGLLLNIRSRYWKGHLWSPGKFAASIDI